MTKIGLGILNNHNNIHNTINLISKDFDIFVVSPFTKFKFDLNERVKSFHTYTTETNNTWMKNHLLRSMLNDGKEYLFIIDDSLDIVNLDIFEKYIFASKISGLQHFSYRGNINSVNSITYENVEIGFSKFINKQLMFFTKNFIKNVGFYDERFDRSIMEQEDLIYRAISNKLLPGWGWFPDLEDSNLFLKNSIITDDDINMDQNWWYENAWFKHKHKVGLQDVLISKDETIINELQNIKNNYSEII